MNLGTKVLFGQDKGQGGMGSQQWGWAGWGYAGLVWGLILVFTRVFLGARWCLP